MREATLKAASRLEALHQQLAVRELQDLNIPPTRGLKPLVYPSSTGFLEPIADPVHRLNMFTEFTEFAS